MQIRPLVALSVGYVLGIAAGTRLGIPIGIPIAVAVVLIVALWIGRERLATAILILAVLIAAALGTARARAAADRGHDDIVRSAWQDVAIRGLVCTQPDVRDRSTLLTVDVQAIRAGEGTRPARGKVQGILYRYQGEPVRYGDIVDFAGYLREPDPPSNPGGFSYRAYLASRGIRTVISGDSITIVRRDRGNRLYRFAYGIRKHIEDRIRLRVDPDHAAVLIGVMFGTQTGIDPEVQRDFQVTGTIHILSASGLHVAVIAGAFSFLLTRIGLSRRWASVLTILAVIVYTIMAGLSPPIVRSAVMYTAYVGALVSGRMQDGRTAVAAAALALLAWNPLSLYDVGFQLSFACVLSILYVMPLFAGVMRWFMQGMTRRRHATGPVTRVLLGITRGTVQLVIVTIAIQIGIAPITAAYFGRVQWAGVMGNVLMVPASTGMLGAGILLGLTGWRWVGFLADRLIALALASMHWIAHVPTADVAVAPFGIWNSILYYLALAAVVVWRATNRSTHVEVAHNSPSHSTAALS